MLSGIWQWIVRLVGGWIPVGDKPIREWFGKLVWVIGIILAVNFFSSIFIRPPANTNNPTVIALPWSKVGDIDQASSQKSSENKRRWWQPIPYIAVAGEVESNGGTMETGAKIEAGLRLDF